MGKNKRCGFILIDSVNGEDVATCEGCGKSVVMNNYDRQWFSDANSRYQVKEAYKHLSKKIHKEVVGK